MRGDRRYRPLAGAALLLILAGCSTVSDTPAPDLSKLGQDPFADSFAAARVAAESDTPADKAALAEHYLGAKGTDQDIAAGIRLLTEAAEGGDGHAALLLAQWMNSDDLPAGIKRDSATWMKRAADMGVPEARLVQTGTRSPDAYRVFSEAGDAVPMAGALSVLLKHGHEIDDAEREKRSLSTLGKKERDWAFSVDLETLFYKGPPDAPFLIPYPYIRLMVAASPGGLAQGERALLAELGRRAVLGETQSACNLAFLSMRPFFVDEKASQSSIDLPTALIWYRRAAEEGAGQAQFWLGRFYEQGLAVQADRKVAAAYYALAARQGHAAAEAAVGDILLQGEVGPSDPISAVYWLRPAAASRNPLALFDLGRIYYEGLAGVEDKAKGLAMIRKAASNDFGEAARKWLRQHQGEEFAVPQPASFGPNSDEGAPSCGNRRS